MNDAADIALRSATVEDIPALVDLESRVFTTDRMATRNFRWMIRHANATLLVAVDGGCLAGYVLVLFRAGSRQARIYSITVDDAWRGRGLADRLLAAAEDAARAAGCTGIRLEVRPDNLPAQRFYVRHGYRRFGEYPRFYEDGSDALRLERTLDAVRPA